MKIQLLFFLLIATPLYAQDEPKDLFSLSLVELAKVMVTGSTLTPIDLKAVPSAVTLFTHEEIKRMGLDTLDELMNLVPGFQSYRSSASSLNYPYSSRGRNIGSNGSEILLLMDGQRLNDPRTSGSALIAPKIPLMQIQRVEFIRGPGAAIYGSNAMMGVVNIITRAEDNEVNVSFGSLNRRQVSLLTTQKIGDVAVDLFGHIDTDNGQNYHTQDGFSSNTRIGTDDPRELGNLNAKIHWHKTYLYIQHTQSKVENFYVTNRLSNGFNQRSAKLSSISLKQNFHWQSIASSLLFGYSVTDVRSYAQLTAPGTLSAISNPSSNDALFASPSFDDYSEIRVQWRNDWDINARSSLQMGIEFRKIDAPEAMANNNFDIGDLANGNRPIRYYGDLLATTMVQSESSRDILGIYSQYQRQLFKMTHFTLGLRYDHFSSIASQLSPRIGWVQKLNDRHSLKFLYGEAFRAPSESELNLLNNPVFKGNPDLKPETVQSLDLIWIGQWPYMSLSLGYFENHYRDSIVLNSTGGGLLQYENVDQDPTKGFEFELYHEFNKHWLMRVSYTHMTEKPNLSFREAHQFTSLMFNHQQGKWNANLIATWHDKRNMPAVNSKNDRIEVDDYWQLFGKLLHNFNQDWQTFVQVKNLLDEDYLTPAASTNLTEGIPNRGREILIGITRKF